MSDLLSQFRRQSAGDLANNTVVGRTADGFPVVGSMAPSLLQDEYENLPTKADYHCRNFAMWEPSDLLAYTEVMNAIANGEAFMKAKIPTDVPEKGAPRIWLEWIDVYAVASSKSAAGLANGLYSNF